MILRLPIWHQSNVEGGSSCEAFERSSGSAKECTGFSGWVAILPLSSFTAHLHQRDFGPLKGNFLVFISKAGRGVG